MKLLKKAAGFILALCLMVPMLGTVAFAADGVLMFSDPETKVGENVSVDLVVQSGGENVGSVSVSMNYDPSSLEFVSGEGFTADGSGTLTYTGTGSSSELRATVEFRALLAGSAAINVTSSTAALESGETLNLEQGSSTVIIAAADDGSTSAEPSGTSGGESSPAGETTDIVVTVNGQEYHFSEAFTSSDLPDGYSETSQTFNGEERKFAVNEAGVTLGYLVDGSGAGSFFLYNAEDATFSPYVQINISQTASIIPLDRAGEVTLPENYSETTLTVENMQFPVWADAETDSRYYIIYALNTRTNEAGLYQYDTADETYQYFEAAADTDTDTDSAELPGILGMISDHILPVLIGAGAVCILLLILIIVFAVKLVHRNQELDDLYDEYDIPFDDEEEAAPKNTKKGKRAAAPAEEEEDLLDYEEEEYDAEDDYDGGYEEENYDSSDYDEDEDLDDFDDDDYDDDFDEDDYDEDDYDDDDEFESAGSSKEAEDDYNINFVDL